MTVTADVIDVSRSGLELEVDEPIELGGKIELKLRRLIVEGEVKDCRITKVGPYRFSISHKQRI
jgi:PilZ domain-containing protein